MPESTCEVAGSDGLRRYQVARDRLQCSCPFSTQEKGWVVLNSSENRRIYPVLTRAFPISGRQPLQL
jgi:hypothetical protein